MKFFIDINFSLISHFHLLVEHIDISFFFPIFLIIFNFSPYFDIYSISSFFSYSNYYLKNPHFSIYSNFSISLRCISSISLN